MINLPQDLPNPSPEAASHSQQLVQLIRNEVIANGGRMSFARYMELALYAPGLGYYSAGLQKLGKGGDFITAPEISPLFSHCLAQQCYQILQVLGGGEILEFGAGSGKMAVDLLLKLEQLNSLPRRYLILEISAELKERQCAVIQSRIPHLFERIDWLECLPDRPISGVVLANEVLDAMPVHRFRLDAMNVFEFYVTWQENKLTWMLDKPSVSTLVDRINQLKLSGVFLNNEVQYYDSEINLLSRGWINSVSQFLQQGLVLLVDYGFSRQEYYHADRKMGTLMCHYRHLAHDDPLFLPGLQDITAHVDFTAVAESATEAGLQVAGFTTQAAFLLNCGLLDLVTISENHDNHSGFLSSQQIQKLTSPAEMGELFKVIALAKGLSNLELQGFSVYDQRQRL